MLSDIGYMLLLYSLIVLFVCVLCILIIVVIKFLLYIRKIWIASIFCDSLKKYPLQKMEKIEIFENNCLYQNLIKVSDNTERIDNYIYISDIINELLNLFGFYAVLILFTLYVYLVLGDMTRKYITLNQPTISTISLTFSIFFFMYLCKKRQEENSKTQNFMKISTFFNNLPPFFSIIKKSYTDFQHYTSNILKDCWYRIAFFLSKNLQIPLLCSYYGVKLESKRYEMDLKRAGLVIIINQKNFNCDFEDRTGTDFDRDRLIQIWEMYGFHVVTYENLDCVDIQRKIRESINKDFNEEYCCLVVVILSHGENGVIFDVNGKPVEIEMIKLIMKKNEKLLGKPKILMIQACQGDGKEGIKHRMLRRNDQENLDDDHCLVLDGPSSEQAAMINADFCQVIATTPGYSAIRNKIKGSWLIQHFCDTMSEDGARDHFLDIILTTKNKISKETWNGTGMVPENKDTFQKYLYFIPVNVNEKKINGKEVIVSILKSFFN